MVSTVDPENSPGLTTPFVTSVDFKEIFVRQLPATLMDTPRAVLFPSIVSFEYKPSFVLSLTPNSSSAVVLTMTLLAPVQVNCSWVCASLPSIASLNNSRWLMVVLPLTSHCNAAGMTGAHGPIGVTAPPEDAQLYPWAKVMQKRLEVCVPLGTSIDPS